LEDGVIKRLLIGFLILCSLGPQPGSFAQQNKRAPSGGFEVSEATISTLQEAMQSGTVTSRSLVEAYLARIQAYDGQGPKLNAIITTNPNAVKDAEALDRERAQKGPRGPLHGIPVIVKDNYNTTDMTTTAGSIALAGFTPGSDAFQVRKLREAGVVIIAKSNMHELASGIITISSLGGQTRNPYDPARNPGGSSGGTGAAIAASFAAVGMGSDTCGSIRIPSSNNNLVGLRPTKGLSSIDGIIPLSVTQDVAGPLARTVTDLAITLDATTGEDTADPGTKLVPGQTRPRFTTMLKNDALSGAQLGLLKPLFGDAPEDQEVTRIINAAVDAMKNHGASAIEVPMPELTDLQRNISVIDLEFKEDFENYLKRFPGVPVRSLQELLDQGLLHNAIETTMRRKLASKGRESEEYRTAISKRSALQQAILKIMKDQKLDALVYPTLRRKPAMIGEPQNGSTCTLSAATGFPAISVPAGFTDDGLPVGIELLGGPFDDGKLVSLAYAFEQSTPHRRAPALTPPLTASPANRLLSWEASASGSEVVPPNSTPLKISVRFTLDLATSELRYAITSNGDAQQFLYATVHRASRGHNGPVSDTLFHGTLSPSGSIALSNVDRKALMDGGLYLNFGTRKFPQGEVRAQLAPPPSAGN
jgi:Asp-tRNA(Asn)/Glu-tRNA(Gln) amidotransferase A subunit family amidase